MTRTTMRAAIRGVAEFVRENAEAEGAERAMEFVKAIEDHWNNVKLAMHEAEKG